MHEPDAECSILGMLTPRGWRVIRRLQPFQEACLSQDTGDWTSAALQAETHTVSALWDIRMS